MIWSKHIQRHLIIQQSHRIGYFLFKKYSISPTRNSSVSSIGVGVQIIQHLIRRREQYQSFLEILENMSELLLREQLVSLQQVKEQFLVDKLINFILRNSLDAIIEIAHPNYKMESLQKFLICVVIVLRQGKWRWYLWIVHVPLLIVGLPRCKMRIDKQKAFITNF